MEHMEDKNTRPRTIALHTLGCKLNYAETSTLGKAFTGKGFEIVDFKESSDVVLINTCSVTENADRECRQIVRKALRHSPDAYVIVTGCYAQLRPEEIASIEGVDLVLGAEEKFRIFDYLNGYSKEGYPRIHVGDIADATSYSPAFTSEVSSRTRAFLKVQDGCDYNCAFCTIPMARGASRSVGIEATLANARQVLDAGYREIVLSGVNVGDYGRKTGTSFTELVQRLVELPGEFRMRISSIEPNLLTDEIIGIAASNAKLCRHFHIPLQSGSADVLRGMRRRYTVDHYRERIERILRDIPDCAIGADVIVGFPGETERCFEETSMFLSELPVSYLHVFSYSERPETHALSISGIVPHQERARRSKMLRTLSDTKRRHFYESHTGRNAVVLLEGKIENGVQFGFTSQYVKVGVPPAPDRENTFTEVILTEVCDGYVSGMLS